jgi:hypothetical protein
MENVISTERRGAHGAHYLAVGDLVLELFPVEEPRSAPADWPAAGVHFEDDPEAIEEPRQAQGLPRDLTGFLFGQLTVRERSEVPGYWRVRCSCGIHKEVSREALRTGSARSCGCTRLGLGPLRANTVDLMGRRFGKLKVIQARSRGRAGARKPITSVAVPAAAKLSSVELTCGTATRRAVAAQSRRAISRRGMRAATSVTTMSGCGTSC